MYYVVLLSFHPWISTLYVNMWYVYLPIHIGRFVCVCVFVIKLLLVRPVLRHLTDCQSCPRNYVSTVTSHKGGENGLLLSLFLSISFLLTLHPLSPFLSFTWGQTQELIRADCSPAPCQLNPPLLHPYYEDNPTAAQLRALLVVKRANWLTVPIWEHS
jgi:hypothetical protein